MNVILYSTHCPRCAVLEKKLKQKNIEYTEVNDVRTMLDMGLKSAPALEVDGKLMTFAEANNWLKEI